MLPSFVPSKTIRRWEIALLLSVALVALFGFWLNREQTQLADKVVRLHIIANSDSAEDQALKLRVRDHILEESQDLIVTDGGLDAAVASINGHLDDLVDAATETVQAAGYDYPVTATLEKTWFPTKTYTDFAMPAGNYTALRIVIGEGKGQNWWCVVFPPLCMGSVTETVADTAASAGLTKDEVALITGESEGYVIKFKAIELWEEFKQTYF